MSDAPPPRGIRRRVYELLEPGSADRAAYAVDVVLIVLVLVNVAAAVLESLPRLEADYAPIFVAIEVVSVLVFTAEYALRLWAAPEHAPFGDVPPWRARLAFARQPQSIIDLLSVAPVWLALFVPADLRSFLILRLLRFFKLARYSPGIASLAEAVYTERRALLASGVILLGTVLICASAMHFAEREAQPDKFGTIPDAMYWAVITLATVGYGDAVPVTGLGRVVAGLTAVTGIMMLALPVGILASAFAREIQKRDFVVTWSMVARVPLFADLDAGEVADIMRWLHSRFCEADEIVVRRGEEADSMYFIATGEVEIELPEGPLRLKPGEFFGEIAILTHSERNATVKAVKPSKLLVLDARDLRHLLDHSPRMAERIRQVAEERVGRERLSETGDLAAEEIGRPRPGRERAAPERPGQS